NGARRGQNVARELDPSACGETDGTGRCSHYARMDVWKVGKAVVQGCQKDQTEQRRQHQSREREQGAERALEAIAYHRCEIDQIGARKTLSQAEQGGVFLRGQPAPAFDQDMEYGRGDPAESEHSDEEKAGEKIPSRNRDTGRRSIDGMSPVLPTHDLRRRA